MQNKLFLLLATIASVNGVNVPSHLPDGLYSVQLDSNQEHQLIQLRSEMSAKEKEHNFARSPDTEEPDRDLQMLAKRAGQGCTGNTMTLSEYEAARQCLVSFADNGGGAGASSSVYCKYRNTIIAMCNYDTQSQSVRPSEIETLDTILKPVCGGADRSGWLHWTIGNKTYWRGLAGEPICCDMPGKINC